jgi:hypothetical protein
MHWILFLLLEAYEGVDTINPFRPPVDQSSRRIVTAARARLAEQARDKTT